MQTEAPLETITETLTDFSADPQRNLEVLVRNYLTLRESGTRRQELEALRNLERAVNTQTQTGPPQLAVAPSPY